MSELNWHFRDDLQAAKEALENILVRKGADGPLWTSAEQTIKEIEKVLEHGFD